eukprot:10667007-Alexandrium_andersonii.AAC.1
MRGIRGDVAEGFGHVSGSNARAGRRSGLQARLAMWESHVKGAEGLETTQTEGRECWGISK